MIRFNKLSDENHDELSSTVFLSLFLCVCLIQRDYKFATILLYDFA